MFNSWIPTNESLTEEEVMAILIDIPRNSFILKTNVPEIFILL